MALYLVDEVMAGQKVTADVLNPELGIVERGTYTPTITATGTDPVLGDDGFAVGKWWRVGVLVTVIIDIYIAGTNSDLGGTSYRVSLPFAADTTFHTTGLLDAQSDIVGHIQTRSETSAQSHTGSAVLSVSGEIADQSLIFYYEDSSTSLGAADFTTTARLKAKVQYVADPDAF